MLPFGFVQSPIIASVCLSKSALGRHLANLVKQENFAVSVYMDDILISSNNLEELNIQMDLIKTASEKSGLPLNEKKQEGPCVNVTAFNICISQGLLKLIPSKLQEFINTYSNSTNEHQRAGILNYVLSVNEDQASLVAL
jgi:predicted house-cleaning noncanonical NTP pyrophosphatase (MazG superfamily)